MNFQYGIRAVNILYVIFIIELVCVATKAKIREHSHHHHHENALLRRLHGHHHKHYRRQGAQNEGENTAVIIAQTELPAAPSTPDAPTDSKADVNPTTAPPTDPPTDPPTTTTEPPELSLEAKQLVARIEKELDECEIASAVTEVEYTPPSMPPHIDRNYYHVTQKVPYYTVGPVDPLGYDPPAVKISPCEKLYRKHLKEDLYSEDSPETEESLEITRLPRDKEKREKVIREMFEFSDEAPIDVSEKDPCRRRRD